MTIQNPGSPIKPEGRNDEPRGKLANEDRKLGGETTTGGMGTSVGQEERRSDLQEARSGVSEMLKKWRIELTRVCRENPLTALGVAFMAGRMLRRRRR